MMSTSSSAARKPLSTAVQNNASMGLMPGLGQAGVELRATERCSGRRDFDATISTRRTMTKSRMEAFSDGVIAILITIMVLELHTPHSADPAGLLEVLPAVGLYGLSFVYLGIYWNNHHHLLLATSQISGTVLWANLHLLFWLSLIPFGTRWMGESGLAPLPTAAYGGVLLLCGVAYTILVRCLLACQPPNSLLASAIGSDRKGYLSLALYAVAVPLTLVNTWLAVALYTLVALMWLIPDRRIEHRLGQTADPSSAQSNGS
jgi:uncharacterized membrane protein